MLFLESDLEEGRGHTSRTETCSPQIPCSFLLTASHVLYDLLTLNIWVLISRKKEVPKLCSCRRALKSAPLENAQELQTRDGAAPSWCLPNTEMQLSCRSCPHSWSSTSAKDRRRTPHATARIRTPRFHRYFESFLIRHAVNYYCYVWVIFDNATVFIFIYSD